MTAFFAFNPRAARRAFWGGAFACAVLCAWAVSGARRHSERYGEARAGLCAGLTLAFAYGATRLRPREGWGVTLGADQLTLSRPLSAGALEIPWWAVAAIRRAGAKQVVVALRPDALESGAPGSGPPAGPPSVDAPPAPPPAGGPEPRVLLARHLFASDADFQALFDALRERVPERQLDA